MRTSWVEKRANKLTTTWRVVWRYDNGERDRESFSSEDGALRWKALLDAAGVEHARRVLHHAPDAPTISVSEVVAAHIDQLTGIEPGTRDDYRGIARRAIDGTLGPIPAAALTRADIARWVNAQDDAGLSPKTIANRHGLLSAALTTAVRDKVIDTNHAIGIRMPTGIREDMTFLDVPELEKLFTLCPPYWRPLVVFLAGTGMRWSEATALQVHHVDLRGDPGTIRVVQAWKETRGRGHRLGPPKTRRARRTLPVPRVSRDDLARLVDGRSRDAYLFVNKRGGPVRHGSFYSRVWQPLVHEFAGDAVIRQRDKSGRLVTVWDEGGQGARPRIHDLRHSFAALAIAAGHSLPAIQAAMGHESIQTTVNTYGHLRRADQDAFAELVPVSVAAVIPPLPGETGSGC